MGSVFSLSRGYERHHAGEWTEGGLVSIRGRGNNTACAMCWLAMKIRGHDEGYEVQAPMATKGRC
jgi:uncharacterized Fe-S cluster-containing radical SAM superfamily protein